MLAVEFLKILLFIGCFFSIVDSSFFSHHGDIHCRDKALGDQVKSTAEVIAELKATHALEMQSKQSQHDQFVSQQQALMEKLSAALSDALSENEQVS